MTTTNQSPPGGDVEARKAAATIIARFVLDDAGIQILDEADPSGTVFDATSNAIDAYLAKLTSTKAEPSRIAEELRASVGRLRHYPNDLLPEMREQIASRIESALFHITAMSEHINVAESCAAYWAERHGEARKEIDALQSDLDRMREALRKHAIVEVRSPTYSMTMVHWAYRCNQCGEDWIRGQAEVHSSKCLAALSPPSTSQSEGEG